MTSKTTPQGTISYTYDAAGRQTSMTVAGELPVNYTYDNANRLTQLRKARRSVNYVYDNANRSHQSVGQMGSESNTATIKPRI